eukprot:1330007-Ditylum_brightwellii.AAC.1
MILDWQFLVDTNQHFLQTLLHLIFLKGPMHNLPKPSPGEFVKMMASSVQRLSNTKKNMTVDPLAQRKSSTGLEMVMEEQEMLLDAKLAGGKTKTIENKEFLFLDMTLMCVKGKLQAAACAPSGTHG